MFLHIGSDVLIEYEKIIGIFDMVDTTVSKHIKEKKLFAEKKEIYISKDIKSCILTNNEVYYSNISSTTLKKRSNSVLNMV